MLVLIQLIVAYDMYNFIINYHVIIYLLLILIPISSLFKNTLVLPLTIFINFFWTLSFITLILYFPIFGYNSILNLTLSKLVSLLLLAI